LDWAYTLTFWFSLVLIGIFDLIFGIMRITSHVLWYIKAKKCVKEENEVPKKVSRTNSTYLIFSILITATCIFYYVVTTNYCWIILSFVFMLITFVIPLINKRNIKTKKVNPRLITTILLVAVMILQLMYAYPYTFRISNHQDSHEVSYQDPLKGMTTTTHYNDPLPLTLKDIGGSASENNNKERDFIGSFLINETVYKDMPVKYTDDASISYTIYRKKHLVIGSSKKLLFKWPR